MREDLRKAFQSNLDTLAKQKHEQLHMVNRELETLREVVDHYTRREKDMEDAKHLLDTERATFDEQKKQLELDRQAFEVGPRPVLSRGRVIFRGSARKVRLNMSAYQSRLPLILRTMLAKRN